MRRGGESKIGKPGRSWYAASGRASSGRWNPCGGRAMTTWTRRAGWMLLAALWLGPAQPTADAQGDGKLSLNDLSLEVAALQTLYFLQPTPEQEKALHELAPRTATQSGPRRPGRASAELRAALAELRQALVEDEDDDRIDELGEKVDKLREDEKPAIDD